MQYLGEGTSTFARKLAFCAQPDSVTLSSGLPTKPALPRCAPTRTPHSLRATWMCRRRQGAPHPSAAPRSVGKETGRSLSLHNIIRFCERRGWGPACRISRRCRSTPAASRPATPEPPHALEQGEHCRRSMGKILVTRGPGESSRDLASGNIPLHGNATQPCEAWVGTMKRPGNVQLALPHCTCEAWVGKTIKKPVNIPLAVPRYVCEATWQHPTGSATLPPRRVGQDNQEIRLHTTGKATLPPRPE